MLTYKSYYNMAPPYLCELINKKESHVNTHLGIDHHQLIMLLHVNGTNWLNISGHQILIVSRRVLKQCYLHNNMDADCKCIYYCYL